LRTGAPVVPLFIDGSPNTHSVLRAVLTPSRTTVRFGPPISFGRIVERKPTRGELEEVTSRILGAISGLSGDGEKERKEVTGISASVGRTPDPATFSGGEGPRGEGPVDHRQAL
jgi:1-acyl-sn-glycerol-3-phosphate acyltransferase